MTRYQIRDAEDRDADPVIRIFNSSVQHSYGAYPKEPVPVTFYGILREGHMHSRLSNMRREGAALAY